MRVDNIALSSLPWAAMPDQTFSPPELQGTNDNHSSVIIGASVGVVVFALLVIFGIGYVRRRKRKLECAPVGASSPRDFIGANKSNRHNEEGLERGLNASEEQSLMDEERRRHSMNEYACHEKEEPRAVGGEGGERR